MALHGPLVRGLCPEVPPPRDRLDRRNSKHRWLPERSPWRRGRGGRVGGRGPLLLLRCCGRGWPRAWPSACFRHAAGRACEERRVKNLKRSTLLLQRRPDRSNRRHPAQTNGFSDTPPFDKMHAFACFVFVLRAVLAHAPSNIFWGSIASAGRAPAPSRICCSAVPQSRHPLVFLI